MIPLQRRSASCLDDLRRIIPQLDQRLFLPWDVQSLHETLHGGHKRVVSCPQIPVWDRGLASSIADFALEVLEDFTGATDEGCHHFDTRRAPNFGRSDLSVEEEKEEGEEGEKTHGEGSDG